MTLVNTTTGEIVDSLSADDARRLTDRIRLLAESLADTLDKLADLIDEARVGSAWLALGYRSWTEYVASEFSGVLPRLDREPRQEFVHELASRGMSTRAIAPVVGTSFKTVARDLSPVSPDTPAPEDEVTVPTEATASIAEAPRPPVIGIDGKTYTPRPQPPHKELARAAVGKYPDLSWQYEQGEYEHCWRMGQKLDEFAARGELDERLANLRRSNEIDRAKRDGTYVPAQPQTSQPRTCPTCGQTVEK